MTRAVRHTRLELDEDGTHLINYPFSIDEVSMTVYGENEDGTSDNLTAWDVTLSVAPWPNTGATLVELDTHTNGVEAEGAVVHSTTTGVATALYVNMASLDLGTAELAVVDITVLGH